MRNIYKLLLIILIISGFILLAFAQKKASTSAFAQGTWLDGTQAVGLGQIPKAERVIEVEMHYISEPENLSINNVFFKSGYTPPPEYGAKKFAVELLDPQGNVITHYPFEVPNKLPHPPPPPDESLAGPDAWVVLPEINLTVTVWWDNKAHLLRVVENETGQVFATFDLKGAKTINNLQNFSTQSGTNLKKQGGLIKQAVANDPAKLDITFIGDDYTSADLAKFASDVDRFAIYLLRYEPFASRASEILFHRVDNTTVDLDCYINGRLAVCDQSKATSAVNSSGVPYDRIFIIYKTDTYSGAGGTVASGYNGYWGPNVFVHEFAHSLAKLNDEYLADFPYWPAKNCHNSSPEKAEWYGIVSSTSYYFECNYANWYKSSQDSIMRSLTAEYFNPISQYYLGLAMDYYTNQVLPSPSPSPILTIDDLKTAIKRYLMSDDAQYWKKDNKVNNLDYADIIRSLR